jgi:hypothetical protein
MIRWPNQIKFASLETEQDGQVQKWRWWKVESLPGSATSEVLYLYGVTPYYYSTPYKYRYGYVLQVGGLDAE